MALQLRPPVITIMGHVDHGKTTLLDYIRHSKVAAGEAGGITQHIGAYQVEFKGSQTNGHANSETKKLTFIDTPGHAAFAKMRERGAQVTDIIVLVVAANDGVKPQTLESIRHIHNSTASVIVAINKTDLDNVYPDMVKAQLAEADIKVNGFGGTVEAIEISAKTGKGVDKLLETLVVMAELENITADPQAPLQAVVIESTKDARKGVLATVIVKQGTLRPRQEIYTDEATGRIRSLSDERGHQLSEVLPGCPAEVIGFDQVPVVGSVVKDMAADYSTATEATETAGSEAELATSAMTRDSSSTAAERASQKEDFFANLIDQKPRLKLIIKADVAGTLEAIKNNLDPDSIELLVAEVGPVLEQEIELAATTGAVIISFHTKVANRIKELAKLNGVKIRTYDVIYELIEELQKQMLKLMEPTIDEVITGEAEVVQIFEMRGERIAGSKVKTGEIKKSDLLHLKRGDQILFNPVIKAMMHGKQDVDVTKAKNECGLTFKNKKLDFQVGDIIVAYKIED